MALTLRQLDKMVSLGGPTGTDHGGWAVVSGGRGGRSCILRVGIAHHDSVQCIAVS